MLFTYWLYTVVFASIVSFASIAQAADLPPETLASYNKAKILLTRYGNAEKQELFKKALAVRDAVNKHVVGQDAIAAALQIRIIQYLNSVGTRNSEPIALHMIGLPGVGKTSILKVLEEVGFPVFKINAEKYPGGENSNSDYFLMDAIEQAMALKASPDQPLILFVDELDKVPEKNGEPKEQAQPVISSLNEILSEGKLSNTRSAGQKLDFSNVFLLTAMNFSPTQIETFSGEILKKEKSFWDFTEQDMVKFDKWIRSSATAQGAVAKVLSLLFRANTVSRLIPDAMVAKALSGEDFDQIVKMNIEEVVARLTKEKSVGLQVTYTDEFLKFLRTFTVFAPSGARMSVKRVDLLSEQLITISSRADLGITESLSLPRSVQLDFNKRTGKAVITIQALTKHGSEVKVAAVGTVQVPYNKASGSFEFPRELLIPLPEKLAKTAADHSAKEASKRLKSGEIRAFRNSLRNDHSLEKYLNSVIFDQDELARDLDEKLHLYMNSKEDILRYQTIPGFTGVGKTAIILAAAKRLGIPVVKLNMQEYSGDSQESADKFGEDVFERLESARSQSKNGKVIVLLEELDKAYEINPIDKKLAPRPVIAYVKDLLTDGKRGVTIKSGWSSQQKVIDLHGVYTVLTMNFTIDRFDIKADPRLTTIEDMQGLYEEVASSPEAIRSLFSTMFLPDTINRLISNSMKIARPLSRQGYIHILRDQIQEAMRDLSSGEASKVKFGAIDILMSKSYLHDYLFAEAVIPSEGGRQAAQTAKAMIVADVLEAFQNLPKSSLLYGRPIEVLLDYTPKTRKTKPQVIASARLQEKSDISKAGSDLHQRLYSSTRRLRFPPLAEFGGMPAKRLYVAAHEFGHALTSVMFGYRFEYMSAVSPTPNIGGYVKPRSVDIKTGKILLADLMVSIGSRAMERVILSEDAKDADSVLNLSTGPSQDILQATSVIWKMIYQLGMDPAGGVIERSGLAGDHQEDYLHRNFFFAEIPDEKVRELSMVVRDLEDYLVTQMLQIHEPKWYLQRITEFARRGGLTEKDFYDLIGYQFPGNNKSFLGEELRLDLHFADEMSQEPETVKNARQFKQGNGKTAPENMEQALAVFKEALKKRLHSTPAADESCEGLLNKPAK